MRAGSRSSHFRDLRAPSSGDGLPLAFFLFIVCIACAIAVTTSGAEVPLADSPIGAAWFERAGLVTASNGRGFLTAWIDYRNNQSEIFAMRSDFDGTPIEEAGVRLYNEVIDTASGKLTKCEILKEHNAMAIHRIGISI